MAYTTRTANKYGAKKTWFKGLKFDSKFEASIAQELELRKKAGEIKDYDCQFKIEMWAYNGNGDKAFKKSHKVDFRVHENDGSYTLLEAKGFETREWKETVKWIDKLWLPLNLDYNYEVVYQRKGKFSIRA